MASPTGFSSSVSEAVVRHPADQAPSWWEQHGVLHRLVCDLTHAELTALRRRPPAHALPWPENTHLAEDLDADSLELMALATRLSEMLHIHEAGIEDYLLARLRIDDWTSVALTSLRRYNTALTFRTSGSSGQTKPCTHDASWLWQESLALGELFPGRRRLLFAVPSHHIYGFLFTVLLPQVLDLPADRLIDLRRSSAAALPGQLRAGDLVVAHPDYWRTALTLVPAFPEDIVGVTSGAPCPDDIAAGLRAAGLSRLVQVFGSSETAGLGWRDDETAPYRCFPYWQGPDRDGSMLRHMMDGTTASFTVQDELVWKDSRHFLPQGRRDEVVQVGGRNVSPAHVAQVLRRHPRVQDASVRLMRPDEGLRLKAFVVPRQDVENTHALAEALAGWVGDHLTAAERPSTFTFGPQLPRQHNGKPADWIIEG